MTDQELAAAIHRVATTDEPHALAELEAELRRNHPWDPEAEIVARQAELKRRRIILES